MPKVDGEAVKLLAGRVRAAAFGAEDFGDWLGAKLARRGARTERARERRETDESLARRLIAQGLEVAGWTPEMLASVPKGDAIKVAIAREVRQFTPMTRAWIANALHMGSPSYLSALLAANSTSTDAANVISKNPLSLLMRPYPKT